MIAKDWLAFWGFIGLSVVVLVLFVRQSKSLERRYREELERTILKPDFVKQLRTKLERETENLVTEAIKPLTKEIVMSTQLAHAELQKKITQNIAESQQLIDQATNAYTTNLSELEKSVSAKSRQRTDQIEEQFSIVEEAMRHDADEYKKRMATKLTSLVDSKAADLLSQYLNESLQGLELGDQQVFILARLEETKADFKKELERGL